MSTETKRRPAPAADAHQAAQSEAPAPVVVAVPAPEQPTALESTPVPGKDRAAELARVAAIGAPYALRRDKRTGKVIEPEPAPNTVRAWGLMRKWPAWLVEGMAAQRFENQELTESEVEDLALATAGLPLGKAKA